MRKLNRIKWLIYADAASWNIACGTQTVRQVGGKDVSRKAGTITHTSPSAEMQMTFESSASTPGPFAPTLRNRPTKFAEANAIA